MRETLINSAVQFLTDPQVADASLDKRLEFLQSKKMTPEEIEEALRRADSAAATRASSTGASTPDTVSAQPAQPAYRPAYYSLQPPPVPKRDWKDYFVMATVSVGVAYGLYEVARRYVLPMIVPPTPASLEADKAALEVEFERTEALVEQLHKDTEALKKSEEQRSEAFDRIIQDARRAVDAVQAQADDRKQDLRSLRTHVEYLQELLPKALDKHRDAQNTALEDVRNELRQLKQLVSNRSLSRTGGPPPASAVLNSVPGSFPKPFQAPNGPAAGPDTNKPAPVAGVSTSAPGLSAPVASPPASAATAVPTAAPAAGSPFVPPISPQVAGQGAPANASTSTGADSSAGNSAAGPSTADADSKPAAPRGIPAWQLAASKDSTST